MSGLGDHLPILPILVPLLAAATMLLFSERAHRIKAVIGTVTVLALVAISFAMLRSAAGPDGGTVVAAYHLGNWSAPFGIVLVADRLTAIMLVMTNVLGFAAFLYSLARWAVIGPRFHALFLLLLMGLNGAFLTGDVFNLYVFFEVLLAASYGLLLHGSGRARVKAGLHYIAINLASSMLFLIGVGLLYGMTGTLNMADLALRAAELSPTDLPLFQAGVAVLGIAFLTKAGLWPLSFWLPSVYTAAAPPVGAIFAVMTKVGVYIILRMVTLLDSVGDFELLEHFAPWLLYGGLVTMLLGTLGVLANKELPRIAAYSTLVSSGLLVAAVSTVDPQVLAAALYYMVGSVWIIGAAFLLSELINRRRHLEPVQAVEPVFRDDYETVVRTEFEGEEVGRVFPAATVMLGGALVLCAMMLAGLPPLSGFVAKVSLMAGMLATHPTVPLTTWLLLVLVVASGMATLLAVMRKGVEVFWQTEDDKVAEVRTVEVAPIALLIGLCVALTLFAGPAMGYAEATSAALVAPLEYAAAVLGGSAP